MPARPWTEANIISAPCCALPPPAGRSPISIASWRSAWVNAWPARCGWMCSGWADMNILVIGAGIGGLTKALALERAGFRPVIYEAASALAPLGVGINVLPHAARELAELGLLDELYATGISIDTQIYRDKWGREVWREPRGLAAGYRWPQIAIHRGELQMLLARNVQARLGADAIRLGQTLTALESGAGGVTARL